MKDFEFILGGVGLRVAVLALVSAFAYAVVAIQLWNVQIRQGEDHREKVSKQYARNIRMPSVRGRIFSSDMLPLAGNRASYDVLFHLSEMRKPGRRSKTIEHVLSEAERLGTVIGRDSNLRSSDILAHLASRPALPLTVFKDLSPKELGSAAELSPAIDGMEIRPVPVRVYPRGGLAANVVGYVGPEDPAKAKDRDEYSYYVPDVVGRSGVERVFDEWMHGSAGNELVIVNHKNFVHEVVGRPSPPQAGQDLVLTIDSKAQTAAERVLAGRMGAVVIMDARNGDLLAMATAPDYDQNLFVPRISRSDWRKLNEDPRHPTFNRAALGTYTPGSIMKPLVAVSLLENGLSPELVVVCDGGTVVGNKRIKCWSWRSGGHGPVNLEHAIEQSCNDFFIENGLRLGVDKLGATLAGAGLGRPTGFILPEGKGQLPSRELKFKRAKQRWNEFDTAILSIGQGDVMITPLQAAVYTAAIANGGTLWVPQILRERRDSDGTVVYRQEPKAAGRLDVSPKNLDLVRKGMWMSVNSPKGSSKFARNNRVELSGKTGTAEMSSHGERYNNTWFIGFGETADGRLISIVVFIEHGDSGGKTCAPLASLILKNWLPEPPPTPKDGE